MGFHAVVPVKNLPIDVLFANKGLILTKPGWFLFSGNGQNSISNFFEKQKINLGFHAVVLMKTFPLM